jgi:hypothetical protein
VAEKQQWVAATNANGRVGTQPVWAEKQQWVAATNANGRVGTQPVWAEKQQWVAATNANGRVGTQPVWVPEKQQWAAATNANGSSAIPPRGFDYQIRVKFNEVVEMPTDGSMVMHAHSALFANTCELTSQVPAYQNIDDMEAPSKLFCPVSQVLLMHTILLSTRLEGAGGRPMAQTEDFPSLERYAVHQHPAGA